VSYETIQTRVQGPACFIRFDRPAARNAINARMLDELWHAIEAHESQASIVVLEGSAEHFCFGADFDELGEAPPDAQRLYDLWCRLALGPQLAVAHVRGKVNAGGVGFVAASDIVIAGSDASFSLSELLFGLLPACVMPFLMRRIGTPRANVMALGTQPVDARQALQWGLVDTVDSDSEAALRKLLLRARRLSSQAVAAHKRYVASLDGSLGAMRDAAVAANREAFGDARTLELVRRYARTGMFPWETD
jgi:polyketide biosynthesis enoyl-CoA hydratase PksH